MYGVKKQLFYVDIAECCENRFCINVQVWYNSRLLGVVSSAGRAADF